MSSQEAIGSISGSSFFIVSFLSLSFLCRAPLVASSQGPLGASGPRLRDVFGGLLGAGWRCGGIRTAFPGTSPGAAYEARARELLEASWDILNGLPGASWRHVRRLWELRGKLLGHLRGVLGASSERLTGLAGGMGTSEAMFLEASPGTSLRTWRRDLFEVSRGLSGGLTGPLEPF